MFPNLINTKISIQMKTTKNYLKAIITAFLLITMLSGTFAQDAREIISRMEENMRGDASYSEMSMEVVRPRYTREVSMKSWSLGDDYSMIYITAPARDEGTAFLKRGNEIWNYQPNIDRTVKMPPSMMSQSWLGPDFTNVVLVNASSLTDDYTHKLLGEEDTDGQLCYIIEMKPEPDNPVVYEKVIQYVSREHYLPVKTENFDERDELVNTIHFREVKSFDGRLLPAVMEIIPHDQTGRKTVITTHNAEFGIDISESFFSIENLTEVN